MHYLTKALSLLTSKGVYYTPKKVTDKIQLNLLIGNPPYEVRKRIK